MDADEGEKDEAVVKTPEGEEAENAADPQQKHKLNHGDTIGGFPKEFVILTAFFFLNNYLASVLKVNGYTVNTYLVKIFTTLFSMLFRQ